MDRRTGRSATGRRRNLWFERHVSHRSTNTESWPHFSLSATLGYQADLHIEDQRYELSSGLLLGPSHSVPQSVDMFDAITPHAGQNAFLSTLDVSVIALELM